MGGRSSVVGDGRLGKAGEMLKVEEISKTFGELPVFSGLDLSFPDGQITAILGPSGCGKTTLLNMLAGIARPDRGRLEVPHPVSYLFQEPRLLPWLTVRQNVAFVLQDKINRVEIGPLVQHSLQAVGLEAYGDFYPSQLSGGLRQRAALARAFSYPAPVLLMDEPFKSLDVKSRFKLIDDFIELWRANPRTVVAVTHDLKEGLWLGDRIVVLSEKPTRVRRQVEILCPREERKFSPEILRLEAELLALMLDE